MMLKILISVPRSYHPDHSKSGKKAGTVEERDSINFLLGGRERTVETGESLSWLTKGEACLTETAESFKCLREEGREASILEAVISLIWQRQENPSPVLERQLMQKCPSLGKETEGSQYTWGRRIPHLAKRGREANNLEAVVSPHLSERGREEEAGESLAEQKEEGRQQIWDKRTPRLVKWRMETGTLKDKRISPMTGVICQ